MRLKFKQPPRTPIGIDVGGRCVKAVQLRRGADGKGWRLAAAAVVPREQVSAAASENAAAKPPTAGEVAALAAVLDRQGFTGRDVVLAAPGDRLLSGVLELPPRAAGVPIEQLARVELARTHRCAPNTIEMGCWDLPAPARAGKSSHVMAVACAHADADALLDPFEAAGLNVCGLDAPVLASARACGPLLAPPPDLTAVLDLGWRGASLALLLGGTVVYSRLLADAGVGRLRDALTGRLRIDADVADYLLAEVGVRSPAASEGATETTASAGGSGDWQMPADAYGLFVSFADALLRELRASFSYAVHQYANAAVTRLLLVGGGGAVPGLAGYAAAALAIDVRPVAPAGLVECPPGTAAAALAGAPVLTGALGLAQYPGL